MKEILPLLYEICISVAVAIVGGWITWADLKTKEIPPLGLGLLACLIGFWAFLKGDFISHLLATLLSFSLLMTLILFFSKKQKLFILGGQDLNLLNAHSFVIFYITNDLYPQKTMDPPPPLFGKANDRPSEVPFFL